MEGFFTKDEYEVSAPRRKVPGCGACKLNRKCLSPKMPATGAGRKRILMFAEAPGELEDRRNTQLIGDAGQELREELEHHHIELDVDCVKTNALICRPPKNRTPSGREIECCRPNLLKTIEQVQPKLIIPLGKAAVNALYGHRLKEGNEGIGKWRGFTIPDRDLNAWVCPTLHPSYILRQDSDDVSRVIWRQDLARAFRLLGTPFPPWQEPRECVRVTRDPSKVSKYLHGLLSRDSATIAYDYETSGIKPHARGHLIRTIGVADSPDRAFAFPASPEIIPVWKKVLAAPHLRLMAQDIKYEGKWSREILEVIPAGWLWDTMLCSHVIDNRPYINSLKFQAFVRFGQGDYSSHLNEFMRSQTANDMNRIEEAPLKELLIYNAMDALLTFRLALWQMEVLGFDNNSD